MDPKIDVYMNAVIATFTVARRNIEEAMRLMHAEMKGRSETQQIQLLALRRYIRMGGPRIARQWAWTPAEALKHSGEIRDLMLEAAAVVKVFEADNPGLQLTISQIRDLAHQVHLWCTNPTVKFSAHALLADARAKLAEATFLPSPTPAAVEEFKHWLHSYKPVKEPSSAAPGTSDHGQQHAVDFVVMRGKKIIAGTETAKIGPDWKSTGLETRLKAATEKTPAAVQLGRPVLQGPLKHPYEPWHYALPKGSRSGSRLTH
jgi:hypothetical protein